MGKRRGLSYQKRVADINRIYDRHIKDGVPNREIWRRFIYPEYAISERQFYNILKASAESKNVIPADAQPYLDFGMMSKEKTIIKRILNDIRVDLSDEFDQNFEREAFSARHGNGTEAPFDQVGIFLLIQAR